MAVKESEIYLELIRCLDGFGGSLTLATAELTQVRFHICHLHIEVFDNRCIIFFLVTLKVLAKYFNLSSKFVGTGFDWHTGTMETLRKQSTFTLHSGETVCKFYKVWSAGTR